MIGRRIGFAEVPGELEALERRETMGRTVVHVPADGEAPRSAG